MGILSPMARISLLAEMSVVGHKRKSLRLFLMSVKPPKAEVAICGADVSYVPIGDILIDT